jgi:hypothetical protein
MPRVVQDKREWVEKDALMIVEPAKQGTAKGAGRGAGGYKRPTSGDNYYEILQAGGEERPGAGGGPPLRLCRIHNSCSYK